MAHHAASRWWLHGNWHRASVLRVLMILNPSSLSLLSELRRVLLRAALFACLLAPSAEALAQSNAMPTIQLRAGMHLIQAEVAANDADRQRGLMFRDKLGPQQGMVFLFDLRAVHCMWMKNTLIPLSVAFLDDDGVILNIEDMQPQTEKSHCAAKPARFALEMNQGWFKQRGIRPGTRIDGVDRLFKSR
ncbi:DUF192 domain-containing protein [Piscinibacterium candidicorallinum]|uniref:DUF192 domain-containing protein n=1 Tax=Piscinibacterium candidicorallinum TaxID=1793872 RepID=A0ABV7H3B4_9BURK